MSVTGLALRLRHRGVILRADGSALEVDAPAGVLSNGDRRELRKRCGPLAALAQDLAAIGADGTALLWRGLYEELSDDERTRLEAEAAAGDDLAALVLLAVLGGPCEAATGESFP